MGHNTFLLILAIGAIRWADPTTWPWVVWVWLAMLLVGFAQPLWRWLKRQRAQGWPTVPGRIESVEVKKKLFAARGNRLRYAAELAYKYALEGQYHSGRYRRDFAYEQEGWEFARDLKGKSVLVSYNPSNPAKSLLLEDAVNTLLASRPPAPAGNLKHGGGNVPGWARPLLWPFVALSAIGLALSLWVHLAAVAGRRVAPEAFFWMLHIGIFVVWIPAVLVSNRRVGSMSRKDFWKLVLRGAPEWMLYMVYGFLGYAMLNFAAFMLQAPQGGSGANPPAVVWRGFSGHWMAFYSAALAILYSAVTVPEDR